MLHINALPLFLRHIHHLCLSEAKYYTFHMHCAVLCVYIYRNTTVYKKLTKYVCSSAVGVPETHNE